MPKGIIAQTAVILLRRAPSLDTLRPLLAGFDIVNEREAAEDWAFGGPSLVVAYRPEVNGLVAIDVVDRPWPDRMGDPKTDSTVFGAWAMGWFGPFTFPGGLSRAVEQAWEWPEAKAIVPGHDGFLRLRLSYVFGAEKDAKCLPADYDARAELGFLNRLSGALLRHPEALGYFNPNGEALFSAPLLSQALDRAADQDVAPLNLWSNVRLFNFDEDWLVMDTVGNGQLDRPDHEVAFPGAEFPPQSISHWLRNLSLYLLRAGDVIEDGHTVDGPGGRRFRATRRRNGFCAPPRDVLRWLPDDIADMPAAFTAAEGP